MLLSRSGYVRLGWCSVWRLLEMTPQAAARFVRPLSRPCVPKDIFHSHFNSRICDGRTEIFNYSSPMASLVLTDSSQMTSDSPHLVDSKMTKLVPLTLQEVLGDNGVFLCPTHPTAAYYHGQSFTRTAGIMYSMIFNVLGLPSTHVPMGLNKKGLPIGIQVVAGPHQDRLCLAVAEVLEHEFGGWVPPPSSSYYS
uniref:Amidase domain-containing protein n=1 Tax=Timema genevievae TaxID=629358 RepID=A0A7R9PIB9_TIMGE|nr:unnamed protein product [Timema genevievae]